MEANIYVSNNVTVIDTLTNKVIDSIAISDPTAVAITPDGKHVYVVSNGLSSVSLVIDTDTNAIVASIVMAFPVEIAITPGRKARLMSYSSATANTIFVIDTTNKYGHRVYSNHNSPANCNHSRWKICLYNEFHI